MGFGVIIIGDEILSGRRADKHLPKIIELLAARGLVARLGGIHRRRSGAHHRDACAHVRVGRRPCFRPAASAPRPTTTRANAPHEALGVPLELHPEAAELIRARIVEMASGASRSISSRRTTCIG